MIDILVVIGVLALILMFFRLAVRRRWLTRPRRGTFTGMVVYHDWSNRDVQRGTEQIVRRNAGDQENEDDTGEPDFENLPRSPQQQEPDSKEH